MQSVFSLVPPDEPVVSSGGISAAAVFRLNRLYNTFIHLCSM